MRRRGPTILSDLLVAGVVGAAGLLTLVSPAAAQGSAGDAQGSGYGATTAPGTEEGAGPDDASRHGDGADTGSPADAGAPATREEEYGAEAEAQLAGSRRGRAASTVGRAQMAERLPRSTPDALRYEPGISVQQTAHGQASPYVRGMTGQQVVHLFDGVRLNNGIYRQGPNQYFFTVDSHTVDHLDVVRGSASTRYGSDALGGALLAFPVEAPLDLDPGMDGVRLYPRAYARAGTADRELGGRAELGASLGPGTAFLVGGGYRDVGRLRAGGVVRSPATGDPALVPRFAEQQDHPLSPGRWRTQLGTGFREATFDARLAHRLGPGLRTVAAVYGYREMDAPRTDQCPPPEAPLSECLTVAEQLRTLAYAALRGHAGGPLDQVDLTVSFQRHHERRVRDRPRSNVRFDWLDVVDTLGLAFTALSPQLDAGSAGDLRVRYGLEAYRDEVVTSDAVQTLTDIDIDRDLSRGQYLAGSIYASLGAFSELELTLSPVLTLRGGGRATLVGVRAPPDPESGTRSVSRVVRAVVGRAGAEVRPVSWLAVLANVDQGFRAPNLDDLTSRQQTGPGFQFENPDLSPERSATFEIGVRIEQPWLAVEGWAFATSIRDGIVRAVREAEDCPPETPQCAASRSQLQLINASERAVILGAEGGVTVYLPREVAVRATVAYAWGEGPNTSTRPGDLAGMDRVPLSRIPPLNGTVEARWRHLDTGLYAAAALRWALSQDRLAPSDLHDARIPFGGTPGYAVIDLRAGWRWGSRLTVAVVLENLFDRAYRVHGSSINGPGRGLVAEVSGGL